jgi:hypothetical protein
VKRTSYFDGENSENLRFTYLSKSGCPFFLLVNEGRTEISGKLVTDQNGAASDFDPFTGNTSPMAAEMTERGFEYSVTVPPHSVKVIGINPDALITLAKEPAPELHLREIFGLGGDHMTFTCRDDIRKVKLAFTDIHDIADVKVNGKDAGRLMFLPYELDITELTQPGENTVEVSVTGSMANTYGKPVPVGFEGLTIKLYGDALSQ